MPSDAFLSAARRENRQPVVLVAIETPNASKQVITSQDDWEGGSLTRLNATASPGDLILETDGAEPFSGNYPTTIAPNSLVVAFAGTTISASFSSPDDRTVAVSMGLLVSSTSFGSASLQVSYDGSNWDTIDTIPVFIGLSSPSLSGAVTKSACSVRLVLISYGGSIYMTMMNIAFTHQTIYLEDGTTATIALGPFQDENGDKYTMDSILTIDDSVPAGCICTYTARGSDNNSTWTDLGTVIDGAALDAYKYYDFSVTLESSTDGLRTPIVREIGISAGDSQFLYFSTYTQTPAGTNALPLVMAGLPSVGSKLDLIKLGSTGEISPQLHLVEPTFAMLRDGYLRNKAVSIKLGFNTGMAEREYEPLFSGLWYDGTIDLKKSVITVKTRSILQRFQKVKLPKETGGTRNDTTVVPLVWTNENIIDVMLAIIDEMGILDRFIDRASFTALNGNGAPRYGTDWNVTRTLDKDTSIDALKALEELQLLSGVFILQLPDGRIQAKLYDATALTVSDLSPDLCDFGTIELGQSELYTRQHIYYGLIADKKGTSAEDFTSALVYINDTAEINWGLNADVAPGDPNYQKNPGYQRDIFDVWNISANARTALAERLDGWFANPKMKITASKLPPEYWSVNLGELVTVNGLQLPISGETWGTMCSGVKFLVTKKTLDIATCSVSFDLLEV